MITKPLNNISLLTIYSFLLLAASSSSSSWRQYYESCAFSLSSPPLASSRLSSSSSTTMLFLSPHLQTTPLAPPPNNNMLKQKKRRPSLLQRIRLKFHMFDKSLREQVVHTYFHGVHTKNISQIINCFSNDGTIIRDVCNLQSLTITTTNNENKKEDNGKKLVSKEFLGERCNEFLIAHPNTVVKFHHGPTCGRGRTNNWVYAHWYEEGTFSGRSRGIEPDGSPLTVEGQTRFKIDDNLKITEIVITRTFSQWEKEMLSKMPVVE